MPILNIGFDDEIIDENGEITEVVRDDDLGKGSKNYEINTNVYLSPARIKAIEAEYDCVVVNEFGDEYHLSEEERKAKNKYYEAFKVLRKAKRTYRKINEYVDVMREALKCLDMVAEQNGIYDPEEFKRLFMKDKIFVNGLVFPKYKGRDRKDLSWEFITEFILGDTPSSELLPKETEYMDEDEIEEKKLILFTESELERILGKEDSRSLQEKSLYFDPEEDDQDGKCIAVELTKKELKGIIKYQPEILNEIKDIRRSQNSASKLNSYVYDMTADDLEKIEAYDRKHNFKTSTEVPEFKGDIMNDDDYNKFMYELKTYEEECITENYHGKMKTKAEIRELELKALLEDNNWNIKNLYNNKEREKKLSKALEEDRKREKKLKKQLLELKDRKNKRKRKMGIDEGSEDKKGKGKKSSKKKGKKKKEDD